MKSFKRKIAYVLIFFMINSVLPARIFAEESKQKRPEPVVQQEKRPESKIIGEVAEKREKNIKHFLKDDYSYEAAVYSYPVHYLKDGKWEDIDNSLVEGVDDENTSIIENKENDFNIKFAKKADSKKLVKLQKDKYEIFWGLEEARNSDIEVKAKNIEDNLSENDKKKSLENVISVVEYENIQDNIDLQYKLLGDTVKENIIIKDKVESPEFTYTLNTKNLVPKLEKDSSIIFYDSEKADVAVFRMEAPYMYDASGEESRSITVNLEEYENSYVLKLTPDSEWLNSEARKFPITIDPPISTSLAREDIQDSHVSSNLPNSNFGTSYILKTGYGSTSGINKTYISFTLPTLTSADLVTGAVLSLYNINSSTARQVNVHKVNSGWSEGSITYNNVPGFDSKIVDYQFVSSAQFYYWNITPIVKSWYSTGNNTGLMLKNQDETTGYTEYYASDTSSTYTSLRAQVTISYINSSGLESYWTYHSQPIGRGGTGYINDYNGNLIFTHDDLTMSGSRMPIVIKHIYNSNDRGIDIGYGPGWRLNLSQRITGMTIGGIKYYEYIDEDSTRHYFNIRDGVWKDETSLGYTLTLNADRSFTVTDKKNNKLVFTEWGYLWKIIDSNGNEQTLSYNGATLVSVTDGSGRVVRLNVLSNNYLIGITDPSERTTSFSYNGALLNRITYPDNNYSEYIYNSNNNMTTGKNYDGYSITYNYYDAAPYRIKKATESNGSTLGQELNITYGFNTTTFTDVKGRKDIYQFNNRGNTISVKNDDGSASYYKFDDISNVNNLSTSSKLQKITVNYLRNHNLEYDSNWSFINDVLSAGSGEFNTAEKYIGQRSLKVLKTNTSSRSFYQQSLTLEKGKTYTYSGNIKTSGISTNSGKGAHLLVNYKNNSGAWLEAYSSYASGTNGWTRYEVTFTIPSDASTADVIVRTAISNETGIAYFDNLQLENGNIANRYNLVENADFNFDTGVPLFWSRSSEGDSNDTQAYIDGRSAFRFNGVGNLSKSLSQTIQVSGNTNDAFVLSGWAKGDSVPLTPDRYFALDVGFTDMNGNINQWEVLQFNEDSSDWQYASTRLIAKYPYKSVTIYALYYNNANTAHFDNLQLYKEEFGESYQYDAKGNVIATADLAKQQSTFQYNSNNDLVKSIDPKGSAFNYEYSTEGKRNLIKATSAENVIYSFSYDSNGNPKTSKIGDGTTFIQSEAAYAIDDNYIDTLTDSEGNLVNFDFDTSKGTLINVTDANRKTTTNIYDNMDRLKSTMKTASNVGVTNSYLYLNDKLDTITHNSFSYKFGYDSLNNKTTVAVGGQNLITNKYETVTVGGISRNTGLLKSSEYGNGQILSSDYDNLDRVTTKKYNGNIRYKYEYDASGNVGYQEDLINGVNYRYIYDTANRLVKILDSKGNSLNYDFDSNNNVSSLLDKIDNKSAITLYGYDKDNRIDSTTYNRSNLINSSSELFPFNGTAIGTKGTKAITQNISYGKDENGKTVLAASDGTKAIYNFSVNKNSGTMSTWVKVGSPNTVRYISATEGASNQQLDVYVGTDNKLNLALRNTNGSWLDIISTSETVNSNQWYFVAYKWQIQGGNLTCTLFLNGIKYSASTSTFQDFTGANTSIGGYLTGEYTINGQLESFSYSAAALTDGEINSYYQFGRAAYSKHDYDSLGRLKTKSVNTGTNVFSTSYNYQAGINGSTTNKISSINNNGSTISYKYDVNGNIETINTDQIKYYYNELNEIVREDNKVLNKTITYNYDAGGNLLNKIEYPYTTSTLGTASKTYNYSFGDSNWKDKLTNFDGKTITYDAIGNPLTYNGYTYTWEEGRQLSGISGNSLSASYKYNDSGKRTQKTINGVTTKYHLVGNSVTYEDNGTDKVYYTYDASGHLVSMNLNGVEYYYIRNAQGDIIGLFDKNGATVASYTYDSWGKLISIKDGSGADITNNTASVGYKNPYRYRGYRYDTETGLYYLQSRYYNPEWGRFINADAVAGQVGELLGHNLFAYCKNNPINKQDPSGFLSYAASDGSGVDIPKPILSVIITSAATGAAANATDNYVNNTTLNPSTVNEANNALKEVGVNRSSRRALVRNIPKELRDLEIPAEGILKYQKVVGLLGTALYGLVAIEDWKNNFNLKDRAISIGIDTLGLGAGVVVGGIIGVMNAPVLVSAALVFGAGYFINKGTSSMKNKFNVN